MSNVDHNGKEVPCKYLMSAPRNFYLFPQKLQLNYLLAIKKIVEESYHNFWWFQTANHTNTNPSHNSNVFQYNTGIKFNIFVICIFQSIVFLLTMRHDGDLMIISVNLILWFLKSKTFVAPFITRFGSFPFHSSILEPHLHLKT